MKMMPAANDEATPWMREEVDRPPAVDDDKKRRFRLLGSASMRARRCVRPNVQGNRRAAPMATGEKACAGASG
jgi:hypothetical protein